MHLALYWLKNIKITSIWHTNAHRHSLIHFPYFPLLCWSSSGSCECGVNRLLPVCGTVRGCHSGWVSNSSVQRPLCRPHVGEGWVQPWGLAGVGIVCPRGLMVSVIELSPGGQRGECRTIVREAERGVGDVGAWGGRGRSLDIVAARHRLALDLSLGGVSGRGRDLRLLLLFGEPGRVATSCSQGICVRGGWGAGYRGHGCTLRVAIWRKVLVKLIYIEWLNVGHHFMADLTDVHGAKVNVGFSAWGWWPTGCPITCHPEGSPWTPCSSRCSCCPLPFGIRQFARLELCLWGGGWCRWAMTLT